MQSRLHSTSSVQQHCGDACLTDRSVIFEMSSLKSHELEIVCELLWVPVTHDLKATHRLTSSPRIIEYLMSSTISNSIRKNFIKSSCHLAIDRVIRARLWEHILLFGNGTKFAR